MCKLHDNRDPETRKNPIPIPENLVQKPPIEEKVKIVNESVLDEEVKDLLTEYEDVFPKDLPAGLRPLRGIEHAIDLLPGAQLPNKPAYRCNPRKQRMDHLVSFLPC